MSSDDGVYFYGVPGGFLPEAKRNEHVYDNVRQEGRADAAVAAGPSWAGIARSALRGETAEGPDVEPAVPPPPVRVKSGPLCSFFMSGRCRNGAQCRFRHEVAAPEAVAWFESRMQAQLDADDASATGAVAVTTPGSAGALTASLPLADAAGTTDADADDIEFAAAGDEWLAAGIASRDALLCAAVAAGVAADAAEADTALAMAERNASVGRECGICLEEVTSAPGRHFGLLTSCTHAFCLDCVRAWRGRVDLPVATTRCCPVCRRLSYCVVPSSRFVSDAGRKAVLLSEYKSALRTVACRHWAATGACPFGSSCWYDHGGAAPPPKPPLRFDVEGNTSVLRAYRLNDFLK